MNLIFVYKEQQISRSRAVTIPNVGEYIKANDCIYRVQAVMHDFSIGNNGAAIIYLVDTLVAERKMLKYS